MDQIMGGGQNSSTHREIPENSCQAPPLAWQRKKQNKKIISTSSLKHKNSIKYQKTLLHKQVHR